MKFWSNYWWLVLLIVVIILLLFYLLWRWYKFYHIDYNWEKRRHFPQWSKVGIITRDNYLLKTSYSFVEQSKCIVIGIHGLGGAKEDFNRTKQFLTQKNISFLSFDQRNWGENRKWKYHTLGTTVCDIQDILDVLKERFPNQKIFLLGEGFGASLAALAFKKVDNQVTGIILANFITNDEAFKLTSNSFFKKLLGCLFYKDLPLTLNYQPEIFSDQPQYIEIVSERNFRHNNKTFSLLYLEQAKRITKEVIANINNTVGAVLIIQSGEDIWADYDVLKENEKKWREGVTYQFYQVGKHAILNDSHTEMVLKNLISWLENNLAKLN